MLNVRELKVRSLARFSHLVSWEIEPTPEDSLDYRFQLLRSEGPEGPWNELSEPFIDRFLFLDIQINPFHIGRSLHYLLRVVHKEGASKDFGPVHMSDEPDLIALEIRRHWDVHLHELNGRRCWYFPVRTFGTLCSNCYDKTTQRVTESHCPMCFGTGFARGFHHPIEVWIRIDPTSKNDAQTGAIVRQEQPTLAYMSAFPDAKQKDLIVEPNHNRWRVTNVKSTERLRTTLHQELTITQCTPSDIEHMVPVEIAELEKLALAEVRNYRFTTTIGTVPAPSPSASTWTVGGATGVSPSTPIGLDALILGARWNIAPIGPLDGINRDFYLPDKALHGSYLGAQPRVLVWHNSRRLSFDDYQVIESGGLGTGFDQIHLLWFSPSPSDILRVDYIKKP